MKHTRMLGIAFLAILSSSTFAFSGSKFMTKTLQAGEVFNRQLIKF